MKRWDFSNQEVFRNLFKEDPLDPTSKIEAQQNYPDNDEGPDNDDDQCEEWER